MKAIPVLFLVLYGQFSDEVLQIEALSNINMTMTSQI